jgi:hypothetical protein
MTAKRLKQVDEAWPFCYAKQKNVPTAKAAPEGAGDIWTWVGLDAQSKLAVSWYVGGRDSDAAMIFMDDLAKRLANRVQLTSDGHKAYLEAVEGAFGADIDYAMLVKVYGPAPEGQRRYSPAECIGAVKHRVEGNPGKVLRTVAPKLSNTLNGSRTGAGPAARRLSAFPATFADAKPRRDIDPSYYD